MLLLLRGSSDDNSAFSKKDAKFVAVSFEDKKLLIIIILTD